jgi:hypothetical protein
MENEEVLEIISYLFYNTDGWKKQTMWIGDFKDKSRNGLKYKDPNSIELMKKKKLIKIEKEVDWSDKGLVMVENIWTTYHYYLVSFNRKKLIEYLIDNTVLKWGELTIYPNGVFEFKDKKSNKFKFTSQAKRFVGYLMFLGKVSNKMFAEFYKLEINKRAGQTIEDRIRKIKFNAVKELKKYDFFSDYAEKMILPDRNYGYFLSDYSSIEIKPVTNV